MAKCNCGKYGPGPWQRGWCRPCWLADRKGRRINSASLVPQRVPDSRKMYLPCIHEGKTVPPPPEHAGDGKTYLQCEAGRGVVCKCRCNSTSCHLYQSDSTQAYRPIERRHFLAHLFPVRHSQTWRRNVDHWKQRASLFNGRRIVAVAQGSPTGDVMQTSFGEVRGVHSVHHLDPWQVVADYLGDGWEVVPVENNRLLREVVSWPILWGKLEGKYTPNDAVFWCHGKGVTRPDNPGTTCHRWTDLLYEANLDYWKLVADQLQEHPITGAFKKNGPGFKDSQSRWHYSGGFFWVRADEFFSRNWRRIDSMWWGTESFPGVHYMQREAGCIFHEGRVPELNMYDMNYLLKVEGEYRAWALNHRHYRTA